MFLTNQLHNDIVSIIARNPGLSIDEVYAKIESTTIGGDKISLSQFYKIMKTLVDIGVLLKYRGGYTINMIREKQLQNFLNIIQLNRHTHILNLPKNDGDKEYYFADSLAGLDVIWLDLFSQLLDNIEDNELYFYDSHPYHILSNQQLEKSYYKLLSDKGIILKQIFGNNTWLDNYGLSLTAISQPNVKINTNHEFMKDGYSLGIVGDYIIEIIFPPEISLYFSQIFKKVGSIEDIDLTLMQSFFSLKIKCKCSVMKNKLFAERMKLYIMELYNNGK